MKKSTINKVESLVSYLLLKGWKKDSYGNYKKEMEVKLINRETKVIRTEKRLYRVKMQETSIRIESQAFIVDKNQWFKVDGCYNKDIQVFEDGVCRCGNFQRF